MCSLDFGEIACNKYPVLLLLLLLLDSWWYRDTSIYRVSNEAYDFDDISYRHRYRTIRYLNKCRSIAQNFDIAVPTTDSSMPNIGLGYWYHR